MFNANNLSTFVHGTYVGVVIYVYDNVPEYRLHTFDFNKRGRHALPLWSEEGGGTERRSVLEDGRKFVFEGNEGMFTENMLMLGDGTMVYMDQAGGGTRLHVWEVVSDRSCVRVMVLVRDRDSIVGYVVGQHVRRLMRMSRQSRGHRAVLPTTRGIQSQTKLEFNATPESMRVRSQNDKNIRAHVS